MGAAFKIRPSRDKAFKEWIRTQPCAISDDDCEGWIEAAHVAPRGQGRMGGRASDYYCTPLCRYHHHDKLHAGKMTPEEVDRIMLVARELLVEYLDQRGGI